MPKLVVAGSRGWGAAEAWRLLDRCDILGTHVVEAGGLSSPALMHLIAHSRALIAPAFGEGFGLPAIEALTLNVPVLASDIQSLVLDLAELEYISSAGVRSIFKARKALASRSGKVLVLNPQPQIKKVFDVVKAVPLNEIFSSAEEADAYLDMMQRKVLRGGDEDE